MKPLCCLDRPSIPIVVDASAAINLSATGCARDIVAALPHELIIVRVVLDELTNGLNRGWSNAECALELVDDSLILPVELGEVGWSHFGRLVSGSAEDTVDDGEAATIACAVEKEAIALIDERKANRICEERFSGLSVASTVDILAHPEIARVLGQDELATAVYNALQDARMSVQQCHLEWVIKLIGPDRADKCRSLPRSVRGRCC